jgi:hypothetical protein
LKPRTLPQSPSFALVLVLGCGPGEDESLETEDLHIHGELGGACSALGRLYERELARVELALGRELLEPVDVLVGRQAVEETCMPTSEAEPLAGCAPSGTEIVTTLPALSHELVHAIRQQHGVRGSPFIEEGLATVIGTGRPTLALSIDLDPTDPEHAIAPQLEYDWFELPAIDRSLGAHFLHWMAQAYGPSTWRGFLWAEGVGRGDAVAAAFDDATGETLTQGEARWREDAEAEVRFSELCNGRPAPELPAAGLVVEASACCDDPDVEQAEPPLLRMGHRCFTLPADTTLDVQLVSGDGELVLRPDGCEGTPMVLGSGQSTRMVAGACRWQVMVVGPEQCDADGEASERIRYVITPDPQ